MALPKCPRCGSKSYTMNETVEEIVIYPVLDGVLSREALDHQPGSILGVACECGCGHLWTPRRIKSIDDAEDRSD